jgi:hypothetical protein
VKNAQTHPVEDEMHVEQSYVIPVIPTEASLEPLSTASLQAGDQGQVRPTESPDSEQCFVCDYGDI